MGRDARCLVKVPVRRWEEEREGCGGKRAAISQLDDGEGLHRRQGDK